MKSKLAGLILMLVLVSGTIVLLQREDSPGTVKFAQGEVQFNRDIRPLFSETCFNCHGPDEHSREAELRFDLPESALSERDGGVFALVAGSPEKSEAWKRIVSDDPDLTMPPPDSHFNLSETQKGTIKRWIESGAKYQDHWAFETPRKAVPPVADRAGWDRSAIDRFVLARLKSEGLSPSEPADKRTLIRRLSYDLTGLPPSLEELYQFLDDDRPDAYELLVDRILDSPHYGERMALTWLDLARYADTNGDSRDGARTMWVWRDWVIQAYNEDKPYDVFLREQLAGDLLPDATEAQIVATGFNRNHMITAEGGTIKLENLTNYAVDRVKTTSEAFLGLTMACAQCHDHKYDPISQEDFYRMFAYFNTLSDKGIDGAGGKNAEPIIHAKSPLHHKNVDTVRDTIEFLKLERQKRASRLRSDWESRERESLEQLGQDLAFHEFKPLMVNNPNIPPSMVEFQEEAAVFLKQQSIAPGGTFYSFACSLKEDPDSLITGLRIEFLPHPEVNEGSLGYGKEDELGAFGVSAVSVSAGKVPVADFDLNSEVALKDATASYSHEDYPARAILDPRWPTAWSPLGQVRKSQHLTLTFEKPVDPREAPYFSIMVNFQQIANAGYFKMMAMTGKDDGTNIPSPIQRILNKSIKERTQSEIVEIANYHELHDPELESLNTDIATYRRRLSEMTEAYPVQVMDTAKNPRKTYILNRGSYDQPGREVEPGVPAFLPPLPEAAPGDRRALADWFTDPSHPLTSRVAVNRIWQLFFGNGFVSTSADFGAQGEWPSHQELLDYLAVDFIENGWSVKALVKQIVMSQTYRQRSEVTEEQRSIDPENRLLSRGPRFRLQGEFIRDTALKASGLLNDWIGGSSVKPYQPRGIWREISHYGSVKDLTQVFVQDQGLNLYRRSLYTLWKRTSPPPSMMAFDAPNRELCVMQRETTNTPLQALTLLNDPQFVEAGRVFAERILLELVDAADRDRVSLAFETVTSRLPRNDELEELVKALEEQRVYFERNEEAALAVLGVGEAMRNGRIDVADHAAFSVIANLIFNLSEAVTKG